MRAASNCFKPAEVAADPFGVVVVVGVVPFATSFPPVVPAVRLTPFVRRLPHAESLELPGADLSNEALTVQVVPKQEDEFTCSVCFLVHHRSQLASAKNGVYICTECAG